MCHQEVAENHRFVCGPGSKQVKERGGGNAERALSTTSDAEMRRKLGRRKNADLQGVSTCYKVLCRLSRPDGCGAFTHPLCQTSSAMHYGIACGFFRADEKNALALTLRGFFSSLPGSMGKRRVRVRIFSMVYASLFRSIRRNASLPAPRAGSTDLSRGRPFSMRTCGRRLSPRQTVAVRRKSPHRERPPTAVPPTVRDGSLTCARAHVGPALLKRRSPPPPRPPARRSGAVLRAGGDLVPVRLTNP